MPLQDHFQPPLRKEFPWTGIHSEWAGAMARELNQRILPAGYRAIPNVQLSGGAVEIDVATLRDNSNECVFDFGDWKAPAPAGSRTIDIAGLDTFEVQVIYDNGELNLVAAIELISPANKDRPTTRRAFCSKCMNYLKQRVALIIVDVVTEKTANLHNELLQTLQFDRSDLLEPAPALYVVAYRPIKENGHTRIDWSPFPLAVGAVMPKMPLWIGTDFSVPVDLETTYATACAGLRMPASPGQRNGK